MQDRRCRFGLAARIEMVQRREAGESFRAIARSMACSPNTVRTAWQRWAGQRRGRPGGLFVPVSAAAGPAQLPARAQPEGRAERSWTLGQRTNWGPMRLAALTGRHRATIWKVLNRHGVSRRRRGDAPDVPAL